MVLSVLMCEVTSKDSKLKLSQATRRLLRSFGQIYYLFSSIDLQYAFKQSRILAVHVSRSALQSRFTEQFFSKSRFTDTKKGRSRCQSRKFSCPPPPPPFPFHGCLQGPQDVSLTGSVMPKLKNSWSIII